MFAVNIKIYAAISHLAALNLSSQSLDHTAKISRSCWSFNKSFEVEVMSIGRNLFIPLSIRVKGMICHLLLKKSIWECGSTRILMYQCSVLKQQIRQCKQLVLLNKFSNNNINKASFLTLYKSYIRPHLEYSTQVWYPYKMKDIDISEKVQQTSSRACKSTLWVKTTTTRSAFFIL